MSNVVQTGTAGTAGKSGATVGVAGSPGANGGIAAATNVASLDAGNAATATGGAGGAGGAGGGGIGIGGAGGAGGAGGKGGGASASAASTVAYSATYSTAFATGGRGGRAGDPGNAGTATTGAGGNGGAGGTATAKATTSNAGGRAQAAARSVGGAGGYGTGAGKSGGAAGVASGTTASATGINAYAYVGQTGGAGGGGYFGAAGVAGAASALTDAVGGSATAYLQLHQVATGGAGGYGGAGKAGAGGAASSDLTAAVGAATGLGAFIGARGGTGGLSTLGGGAGGSASGSVAASGARAVSGTARVYGGTGGMGTGTGNGGTGGAASGSATASSTTKGSDMVAAALSVAGGAGGGANGSKGDGAPGAGVYGAAASAVAADATGGSSSANARATGGAGGRGTGAGGTGGAGAIASGTKAGATGFSARAAVMQSGGYGGYGGSGAAGGAGAASSLTDAASGSAAAGGYLSLYQTATGGAGGSSSGGVGGAAGAGKSSLTVTDTKAATLNGGSTATGGAGGGGVTAAPGASGLASIALTGAGGVTARSTATGGTGGSGDGTAAGAAGGSASATATATGTSKGSSSVSADAFATGGSGGGSGLTAGAGGAGGAVSGAAATAVGGNAANARASATVRATGGAGGRASGAGNSGGAGGLASLATSSASAGNAYARAYQTGGRGGHGYGGAVGGAGADSSLINAVAASATGYMLLRQVATGGDGGYSATGTAGAGGAASSSLGFLTAGAPGGLTGHAVAVGGGSGIGKVAAPGGDGTALLSLTGVAVVNGTASATGGAGGAVGGVPSAPGGAASATAAIVATGTASDGTATAMADATGGTGNTQGTADAIASAATAAGQLAMATATAAGSAGTAQAAAATPGGGAVGGVLATAVAQVGSAATAQASAARGTVPGFGGTGANAYGLASTLPDGPTLAALLAASPAVDAVLGAGNADAAVFGMGVQGAAYAAGATGARSYGSAIAYTLDATQFSGRLLAGLLDSDLDGTGFTALHFSVTVGGTTVVDENFAAAAAAQSYFGNRLLDLGAVSPVANLVVTFSLELAGATAGSGFGQRFVLGTDGGNVPPVNTVPGLQTGLAGAVRAIAGVGIADADAAAGDSFTTVLSATSGILTTKAVAGVVGNGTATLTLGGTLAEVNAALASLSIQESQAGNDTVKMVTTDAKGGSDTDTIAIGTVALPVISIAADAASVAEGNAGSTAATFTLTRSGELGFAADVGYKVSGAANAADFAGNVLPSGKVGFAVGQATASITVFVAGDATTEPDESFTVTLSAPDGATLGIAAAGTTILNDDVAPPSVVSVAAVTLNRAEGTGGGGTAFTFRIDRTGGLPAGQSVKWAVAGQVGSGTAPADAADFAGGVLPAGTVAFAANETSRLVTLTVNADAVGEFNDRFSVTLSDPSAGVTIGTAAASGIIQNDDSSMALGPASLVRSEGNAGTTAFVFNVNRPGSALPAATVNWAVAGTGAAPADAADFAGAALPSGSLSFAAQEANRAITVLVAGDTVFEADEAFAITLSGASAGVAITAAGAVGTILGDDTRLGIVPVSASKPEGTGGVTPFTFKVDRTGGTAAGQSVSWAVAGAAGTGTVPADAADFAGGVLPSGTIAFALGESSRILTIAVAADALGELNDRFAVTLANATGGAAIAVPAAGGVILNDDTSMAIGPASVVRNEGNAGTTAYVFTVSRPGSALPAATVNWTVGGSGGAPANAADFAGGALPFGTLAFAASQASASLTVNVAGDVLVEADEQFAVTLSGASVGAISTASAIGTIVGDDTTVAIAAVTANKAEGTGGITPFTFKVDRSGGTAAGQSVKWAVAGAIGIGTTPANAADFAGGVLPSGTIVFAANEVSRILTIGVAGDALGETNERFAVTLSGASPGLAITKATAGGVIQNDDTSMAIGPALVSRAEGNSGSTAYVFTVNRPGSALPAASVNWAVAGSGADPATGADFVGGVLPSGTLSFAGLQASASITVLVAGDTALEPDEGFSVALSGASAGTAITTASAAGTIVSDDTVFRVYGNGAPAFGTGAIRTEGPPGQSRPFRFTVVRDGAATAAQSVSWKVTQSNKFGEHAFTELAGPAIASDFVGGGFPSGSVTFAPNERSKVVTVNVAGNDLNEGNSSFFLTLQSPTGGATASDVPAPALIVEDDDNASQIFTSTEASEVLTGNDFDNFFFLGGGNDDVTGGRGDDIFFILPDAIGPAAGSTISLLDFGSYGFDRIDLSLFDANPLTPGRESFKDMNGNDMYYINTVNLEDIGSADLDGTPGQLRSEVVSDLRGIRLLIQGNVNDDLNPELTIEWWF